MLAARLAPTLMLAKLILCRYSIRPSASWVLMSKRSFKDLRSSKTMHHDNQVHEDQAHNDAMQLSRL